MWHWDFYDSAYVKNLFKVFIYLREAKNWNKRNIVTAMGTFYHQVSETYKQSNSCHFMPRKSLFLKIQFKILSKFNSILI